MDLDILFLNGNNKSSTKSLILKSLIHNQNLSNARLQAIIRKEFNKKISYQAIRQALIELSKAGILEKQDKNYFISHNWFSKLKYELNLIEKSFYKKDSIKSINKETTQINLKNLYELGHFILYSLEQNYFDVSKTNQTYMKLSHLWIPFADQDKRERLKQLMGNNKIQVLVENKTSLDLMLSKWYKKFVNVKFIRFNDSACDYIIHKDIVVQIYFNQKLKSKMDRFYGLKGLASLNIFSELSDMTYEKNNIEIIIIRNKEVAKTYKKEFVSQWSKK